MNQGFKLSNLTWESMLLITILYCPSGVLINAFSSKHENTVDVHPSEVVKKDISIE